MPQVYADYLFASDCSSIFKFSGAGVDGLMNAKLPVASGFGKRDVDASASNVELLPTVDVLKATLSVVTGASPCRFSNILTR